MKHAYTYKIVRVDPPANCMDVVYDLEGCPPQLVGVRLPNEGETLDAVIDLFAPTALWPKLAVKKTQPMLFMSRVDQQKIFAYAATLSRLNVGVSETLENTDGVLLLSDWSTDIAAGHSAYMPKESLDKILNKDRLHETGLPTLPTVVINSPEDAPAGTLVKPKNTVTGGFVYQPNLGFPIEDLDIQFSVNAAGDIFVFAAQRHEHLAPKKSARLRMAQESEYEGVVEQITAACKRLDIKGGLHDIQFLFYEGNWCAIDWNPRLPLVYSEGVANLYPCLDGAVAHMLGLPIPEVPLAVFANRVYWDSPIPEDKKALIESFGLIPRKDFTNKVPGIVRVNGVGASEAEINAKFDAMEAAL